VFSQQNEPVNVCQLRDGRSQEAVFESLEGRQLRLRLATAPQNGFGPGELVEVNGPQNLYLGEVTSRVADVMSITVEHALDREALSTIHQVWDRPDVA